MSNPFADDLPRPKPKHEMGQDLSALSLFELDERVQQLEGEILRLKEARAAKEKSKSAADTFFKS